MSRKALLVAVFLLLPAVAAAQIKLLRQPTYHKGRVAFSYLGDIWVANENGSGAGRLTDNKARDIYPRFSPDGSMIAFSSNRAGNYDVYVIPSAGGKARQLTFHTADDTVVGWTPDAKKVIFQSTRAKGAFPAVATLFEVAVEGGLEQPVPTDWGSSASYSPDGAKMAFTRHPGVWSRKHYRGSYAVDLWLMDVTTKKFTRLGEDEYKGNCLWPMYAANGEIYFVADRLPNEKTIKYGSPEVMKSVNNIWKISERGGRPAQVTRHASGNLFFPSISSDGRTIVYEENFGLWKLDTASGKSSEIRIDVKSDEKENPVALLTIQNEADGFSLSPSSRRAAISTHGEVFTVATDRGEVQRVTETFWREGDPLWSPNGKWIAFTSDRTGREEIWIADERGRTAKKLTDSDTEKLSLAWSPDSKWLMFSATDHKLRQVDIESGNTVELASSDVSNISGPQYSPDGKWISYARPDGNLRSHVYVKPIAGGAERMIGGEEFLMTTGARWTPDGKKLLFLAGSGAFSIASTSGRTTMQLHSVSLTRIEKNPTERGVDTEEEAQSAPPAERRPGPGGAAASALAKVEVKIEWDGLDRRVRQITRSGDSVFSVAPSPDSRTYAFVAMSGGGGEEGGPSGAALYTISEDGERLTRLATAAPSEASDAPRGRGGFGGALSSPQWARDGRSIYYLQSRGIYSVAVSEAPAAGSAPAASAGLARGRGGSAGPQAAVTSGAATPRRVSFTVRMEVDQTAERRQVFQEAWRVMKNRFYDAKMHGVDWARMRETYEPLLSDIGDSDELRAVIMQMIGELNASHTGVTAAPGRDTENVQTRYPGFEIEPDPSGYYKVSYIFKKGPADHDYVKIAPGNFILALNGKELKTTDNYWRFYHLVPGRKFEFTVNSKPDRDGAWTVSLEPLAGTAQGNLEYERWVDSRAAMVEKLSQGQVGYLHIRAMDAPSLRKFERDLLANQSKKALIIDQRFNGGGGIDQELLQILNQRRYQATRSRDSIDVQRPARAFFGPMVVMQNERSASDAEMFPDGFRSLGLGKLVGVPTYGAVIGTGAYRLLDGSSIRTPGAGVFTAKGVNMENYGVAPDIYVDNTPADFLAGRDIQIEKAVEVLQAQIK
jgi:tricorn protease